MDGVPLVRTAGAAWVVPPVGILELDFVQVSKFQSSELALLQAAVLENVVPVPVPALLLFLPLLLSSSFSCDTSNSFRYVVGGQRI